METTHKNRTFLTSNLTPLTWVKFHTQVVMVFPSALKIYARSGTIWHFIWHFLLFYCSIQAPVSLGIRSSLILNHTKSIRHLSLWSSQYYSKKGIHRKYLPRLEVGFAVSFSYDLWTTIIIIITPNLSRILLEM